MDCRPDVRVELGQGLVRGAPSAAVEQDSAHLDDLLGLRGFRGVAGGLEVEGEHEAWRGLGRRRRGARLVSLLSWSWSLSFRLSFVAAAAAAARCRLCRPCPRFLALGPDPDARVRADPPGPPRPLVEPPPGRQQVRLRPDPAGSRRERPGLGLELRRRQDGGGERAVRGHQF